MIQTPLLTEQKHKLFFTVVKSNTDRENDLQEKTLNKIDIS